MYFLLAYLIISLACITITGRTLLAYNDYALWLKILIVVILVFAWFSPMVIWTLQPKDILPLWLYTAVAKSGYFLYGAAFLLVATILLRDFVWYVLHGIFSATIPSPTDSSALKIANLITLIFVTAVSIYAVYAAEKMPRILHAEYRSSKILRPLKVLAASDLHITKMTPPAKVQQWVALFNAQKPDIIVLPGDITDDKVSDIKRQTAELQKLHAPLGIYYVLGNHETYFDALAWEAEFAGLGWQVLHNSGVSVADSGAYIAGLPDPHAFAVNIRQALRQAKPDEYRIMLSHLPNTLLKKGNEQIDLQFSGHTHGGQIFPFHYLVKWGNGGFLAGEYLFADTVLLLSRGVGYWGPPMRLLAPSDFWLVNLLPADK